MKCGWFGHKWGKWEQYVWDGFIVMTGLLVPKDQQGVQMPISEMRQKRICKKCGYMQEEKLS